MTTKKSRHDKATKDDKKAIGRPRLFSSPDEFDRLVDLYIASCQDTDKPKAITLTGMVLALGFTSKQGFYEYENYEGFSDSVKRARLLVEQEYENRLVVGSNAAASIFALKNFGWADKHPSYLDELSAKKLERELQIDDEDVQPATVVLGVKDASKPKA
jgi:hypothetical protein